MNRLIILTIFSDPPTVGWAGPSYTTKKEGESFEFFCNSGSKPTPKVTWIKDGAELDTSKSTVYVQDGNKLKIPKVVGEVSGKYRCKVENEFGSSILGWDLTLIVPCKYKCYIPFHLLFLRIKT